MRKIITSGNNQNCLQKFFLLIFLLISAPFIIEGEEVKYPVSAIPPELLKNADLVVRTYETVLEISSLSKVTEKVHIVFTVLGSSAKEKAALRVYYDKDSKISRIKGKIYDASGKETEKVNPDDIIDQSAVSSGALYSDDRVKIIRPVLSHYPYSIEYEFERFSWELVQYPVWRGVDDYHTSIEYASLKILAPEEFMPRYLSLNFPDHGNFPVRNNDSALSWKIRNFAALIPEPLSTGIDQIVPVVYIAPAMILIPGHDPEPATWKAYGMWINWLNNNRGRLPDEIKMKIRQIISDSPDTLTTLKRIYGYFQENTRYISVQIGIGGYQPVDATTIAKYGYGDCKGLTNFLKALFECAGINSYYTLVNAGKWSMPIKTGFPSLQFNHAILCVPLKNDTIWLECTSQVIPFGYLGMMTENHEVLIITPEGGIIARTPSIPKSRNLLTRTAVIDLDSTGDAHISCTTKVTGLQYELFDDKLHLSKEEQKEMVRKELSIPTMNIVKLTYHSLPGEVPEATQELEMTIPAYATLTGARMFIPLNTFDRVPPLPLLKENRNLPFYPGIGYCDTDSIVFRLPLNVTSDFIPDDIKLNTGFGTYSAEVTWTNNELHYVRQYFNEGGKFSPEDYSDYHSFNKMVSKADRNKAIFKK